MAKRDPMGNRTRPFSLLFITGAFCLSPLFGQVDATALSAKYGPPVEQVFSLRPGVVLAVTYGENHQVCKLDIRPTRNASSVIPASLIQQLVDELVPPSTRGTPNPEFASMYGCVTPAWTQRRVRRTSLSVKRVLTCCQRLTPEASNAGFACRSAIQILPSAEAMRSGMGRSLFVFAAALVSVLPGIAAAQGRNDGQREAKQVLLWAGISVPQPIFGEGGTAEATINFGVVNDGTSTVNPKIGASHLSINGVEPKDWPIVINNGLRSPEFEALPPGHFLSFGYQLGERYFAKPGVYTVRWSSENFRAQPITFRVLPANR